jgi:uncharacterized OB-fold protein
MKKKKEIKFWNSTIEELAKLRKPVVVKSVCPKCGSEYYDEDNNVKQCQDCYTVY